MLSAAGIAHAGVGLAPEAAAPAILERAGLKLSFLSYAGGWEQGVDRMLCWCLQGWGL